LGGYEDWPGHLLQTRQEAGLAALRNLAAGVSGFARVTAIIPAHNEAATIAGTIRSLRRQTEPPDRIIVVCDNCTDDTADTATLAGAEVFFTVGNTAKKAGALNQALAGTLPYLADEDRVLVMDADSHLNLNWLRAAAAALRRHPRAGAVCGVFLGEPGGGLIGQLQRNEYIRYARQVGRRRQVPVLSGTGTLFRVSSLRAVALERGRRLPGPAGQYYSEESITEDDEITLALKTLGRQCLAADGCETTTELMPDWPALWTQRIRWQKGALNDLRRYGLSSVTSLYWSRQAIIYFGLFASLACWVVMASAFTSHPGFNLGWTGSILAINFAERLWTVRRAGRLGMLVSALMVPEFAYDTWRMVVFLRAIIDEITQRDIEWGHLARQAAR
jgi:cellulose synthase/poly-beta-1,6-N-acetylglucosamine synthase-like glycosyltransferase